MITQLHVPLTNPLTLVFAGLQIWWISSVFWKRGVARPQNGVEFRKTLERICGAGSGAP